MSEQRIRQTSEYTTPMYAMTFGITPTAGQISKFTKLAMENANNMGKTSFTYAKTSFSYADKEIEIINSK